MAILCPFPLLHGHALTGPLEGYEALFIERDFPAGIGLHKHPGIVVGYILNGSLPFGVNNEPERIMTPGNGSGDGGRPAKSHKSR